ncbi:hypothetical protein LZ554_000807 [Drepanopeziza brunnea f. sp. 'monogermtubi']|nr:hypothetical protein LZ554_000807 [Drepanopeziza brunnea f. sp. 'monogermtubi']
MEAVFFCGTAGRHPAYVRNHQIHWIQKKRLHGWSHPHGAYDSNYTAVHSGRHAPESAPELHHSSLTLPHRQTVFPNLPPSYRLLRRNLEASTSERLLYQEPPETMEHMSDQAALPNQNANWVNAKGAWTIHLVIIVSLKVLFDIIPGVSQETSWTLTNISYMFGSFLMFHWVRGVPFEFNAGAYDNLNMWEQIDNGAQYTPAKKFLLSVPIVLFLLSTHYTHYDLTYFTINFLAVLGVVIPKLPYSHRTRVGLFSGAPEDR